MERTADITAGQIRLCSVSISLSMDYLTLRVLPLSLSEVLRIGVPESAMSLRALPYVIDSSLATSSTDFPALYSAAAWFDVTVDVVIAFLS